MFGYKGQEEIKTEHFTKKYEDAWAGLRQRQEKQAQGRDEIKADATAGRVHTGLLLAVVFMLGVVSGLSF